MYWIRSSAGDTKNIIQYAERQQHNRSIVHKQNSNKYIENERFNGNEDYSNNNNEDKSFNDVFVIILAASVRYAVCWCCDAVDVAPIAGGWGLRGGSIASTLMPCPLF